MNLVLFYEVLSAGIFRRSEAKRPTGRSKCRAYDNITSYKMSTGRNTSSALAVLSLNFKCCEYFPENTEYFNRHCKICRHVSKKFRVDHLRDIASWSISIRHIPSADISKFTIESGR